MTQPLHLRRIHLRAPRIHGQPIPVVPVGLGAGLLVGLLAWQHQVSQGMVTTGMRDVVPLGAYTVAYLTFVAVAAGSLAMATTGLVAPSHATRNLVGAGLGTALAGLVGALLAFMVNLDRPALIYNLLLHPNWSSPVIWSLYAVIFELVVAATLVILLRSLPAGTQSSPVQFLALAGLVAAPLTAGATAGIFAFQTARPAWTGGLTLPLYLVSTVVAGTAAVSLFPGESRTTSSRTRRWLAAVLAAFVAGGLVLTAVGYLTAERSSPDQWAAMQRVLPGGGWSWLFWSQWLVGGLAPLLLLTLPSARRWSHGTDAAAALALLGVITAYIALVPGGLVSPRVGLAPGMALGAGRANAMSFQAAGFYHPTLTEYGVLVGLLCAFLAVVVPTARRHRSSRTAA